MIAKLSQQDLQNSYQDGMVNISTEDFKNNVDRRPFGFTHELNKHPFFQLENLVELSKRMPNAQREYVFAKHEFGAHDDMEQYRHAANNDQLSTVELIQNIEEQNIIIVLRNAETDPIYGNFVNECLNSLGRFVEPITGPIRQYESYIFVSPPQAYTPYHYDPEQNFFMQIRGQKQMAVYDVTEREILPELALERYYGEGQKITKCDDSLFDKYELFDLQPGDGVYVPVTAPHWVRTLDEISISVSINFRSPSSVRRARVYRFNRLMRKIGLSPQPVTPQASAFPERLKSNILGVPAIAKKMIGK